MHKGCIKYNSFKITLLTIFVLLACFITPSKIYAYTIPSTVPDTLHWHMYDGDYTENVGNREHSSGCFTKPYYYYTYTASRTCNGPYTLKWVDGGSGGHHDAKCNSCGWSQGHSIGQPHSVSYTAYGSGYTVPSGASIYKTEYALGCNDLPINTIPIFSENLASSLTSLIRLPYLNPKPQYLVSHISLSMCNQSSQTFTVSLSVS